MAGEERILVAKATLETILAESFPPDEASRLTDQIGRLPDPSAALRALESYQAGTGRPPDPSRLASFKTDDWERSFEWLQLSGLALLFWDRLKRSGAENILPRHVGARLARNAANNQVRVGEMWREFVSINERLESAGVSYAALKGFPLVPDYFPDPSLRSFTDYDYLLSYDSIERAGQALESAGYVCRDRECGAARRRARGNDHGQRRNAGRGRAERAAGTDRLA